METLESILQFANRWLGYILRGYWVTMLILVVGYWTLMTYKNVIRSWMSTANRFYVIMATVAMIGYLAEMLYGWFGPYGQDYKVFVGYRILGPWRWVFWSAFAGAYVLPQLFWFRQMRTFIPYILLVILMMHVDGIVEYFSKDYRDYYSAWWSFGPEVFSWSNYLPFLLFPFILFLLIWFRKSSSRRV